MKINAASFFNFCSQHVPLLRALAEKSGEMSESEVFDIIRAYTVPGEELPDNAWRRLCELQILVSAEPGSSFHLMAEPVSRLLSYLFDEANPATPEMIGGFIASLDALDKQLERALKTDDVTVVGLAFKEVNETLRRIYADLEQTQVAILAEVARFKTTRQQFSVRDKYRRIVYWMDRYVEPMIEIVRADGPMRASFDETERLLRLARENTLFNDHPAVERCLRYLRLVRRHALRVFQQCRKEIQPLYESLRRSSFIAEGAAIALERLQREGFANWGVQPLIGIQSLRLQSVPGDEAIDLALRRVVEYSPEMPPIVAPDGEPEKLPELLRRQWLDSLPDQVAAGLPIDDLLEWLVAHHPNRSTSELLSGFTSLVFHSGFTARFADEGEDDYQTKDGNLRGYPLRLE